MWTGIVVPTQSPASLKTTFFLIVFYGDCITIEPLFQINSITECRWKNINLQYLKKPFGCCCYLTLRFMYKYVYEVKFNKSLYKYIPNECKSLISYSLCVSNKTSLLYLTSIVCMSEHFQIRHVSSTFACNSNCLLSRFHTIYNI